MARRRPPVPDLDIRHQQTVQMGLGEAVQRLITVEFQYRQAAGALPELLLSERKLLYEAMNRIPLDIGFDCNSDGVPDTVEIFRQAAATSCCRILPRDNSRAPSKAPDAPWKAVAQEAVEASFFEAHGAAPPPQPAEEPAPPKPKRKRGVLSTLFGKKESP